MWDFFALYSGIMAIAYGFRAYQLGIPKGASTEIFLLYIAFGAARILSYPVTLIIDRVPQKGNPKWIGWTIILILFWLAVLGAMFASGYAGFSAMMQHLASPP
jgi:putative membrane protein